MAGELEPRLADSAYTVGLLSALELLLKTALPEIIDGLSLTAELEDALRGHTGALGHVLADVLGWEERYLEASWWATEVCGSVFAPAR